VILWEKEISGSCRNYPAQVGILKLESEKREKIERACLAVRLFLCGVAARRAQRKAFNREGRKGAREGREEGPATGAWVFIPFIADRGKKQKS
jgi:hypothetical protein